MIYLSAAIAFLAFCGLAAWLAYLHHQSTLVKIENRKEVELEHAKAAKVLFDQEDQKGALEALAVRDHAAYKLKQVELAKSVIERSWFRGWSNDEEIPRVLVELMDAVRRQLDNEPAPIRDTPFGVIEAEKLRRLEAS